MSDDKVYVGYDGKNYHLLKKKICSGLSLLDMKTGKVDDIFPIAVFEGTKQLESFCKYIRRKRLKR